MIQDIERTTTERLLLRRIRESDLEALFSLHSDPETNRYSPSPMRTLDDARKTLALWLADWARHGVGYWLVERLEAPGVVVGLGGVRHKELEGQQRIGGIEAMLRGRAGAEGPRRAADGASKAARRAGTRDGTTPWGTPLPWPPSLEERGREFA